MGPASGFLRGRGVLVTRPRGQAAALVGALEQAGARVVELPTQQIVGLEGPELATRARRLLPAADWLFFVSPNAVAQTLALVQRLGLNWPAGARAASVGRGTSAALEAAGIQVHLEPTSGAGSEPLMARPELQRLHRQRAVILRGEGGREWLAATLRERGAVVDQLEVYRRTTAGADPSEARAGWREGWLEYTIVTSVGGLTALLELAGADLPLLLDTRLVTVSGRIAEAAVAAGFREPRVAADPGEAALVAAIRADLATRPGGTGEP